MKFVNNFKTVAISVLALSLSNCSQQDSPSESPADIQAGRSDVDSSKEAQQEQPQSDTSSASYYPPLSQNPDSAARQTQSPAAVYLPPSSLQPPLPLPAVPLVVVAAGAYSCNHFTTFNQGLIAKVYEHLIPHLTLPGLEQPELMTSCYIKAGEKIKWADSRNPHVIFSGHETQFSQAVMEKAHGRPLIIVGHSYGGWLSMQLVLDVFPFNQVRLLITIDPISPNQCKRFGSAGCRQAPHDFSLNDFARIKSHSGQWLHYFQTRTLGLHASRFNLQDSIALAPHFQTEIPARHQSIDTDPQLWQSIATLANGVN